MNTFAILSTIIAGLLGGWIGAFLQTRNQYKMNKVELMWQFRLKIYEAEQAMWEQTKLYKLFEAPIKWLFVAASDPRIQIEIIEVEKYAEALKKGRANYLDSIEYASCPSNRGIETEILKQVEKQGKKLDTLILSKINKALK